MYLLTLATTLLTLTTLTHAAYLPQKRQHGTSISQIGSAHISAFRAASSAFVAATLIPNQIVCPGVLGGAPTPTENSKDCERLCVDPSAVSALEQRQSIRPYQSMGENKRVGKTATPIVEEEDSKRPEGIDVQGTATPTSIPDNTNTANEEQNTPNDSLSTANQDPQHVHRLFDEGKLEVVPRYHVAPPKILYSSEWRVTQIVPEDLVKVRPPQVLVS